MRHRLKVSKAFIVFPFSTIFCLTFKCHHPQPSPDTQIVLKTLHTSSRLPSILTRKAPYSFFILHHFSWQRRRGRTRKNILRRSFLFTTFIELYFMHSEASPSPFPLILMPNVIDDSRLSRVCLLNLLSYLFSLSSRLFYFLCYFKRDIAIEKRFRSLRAV